MTIQAGQCIPSCTLKTMGSDGPRDITTAEVFNYHKVLLFAVPGAFTPGCSKTHLPGYVEHVADIKAKGIDRVVCMAVNDPFVMDAWAKAQGSHEILMLSDGNGEFTELLGLTMDARDYGMGSRCKRFAMIVDNGKVEEIVIEPPGGIKETTAEAFLAKL